jgi:hypothetical protein
VSLGKHGLKVLGLSVMTALGLMAVSASTAHAVAFLENYSTITSLLIAIPEVDTLLRFQTAAGGEIDCTNFDVLQGDLLGSGKGEEPGVAHVEFLFLQCNTYVVTEGALEAQPKCEFFKTALDREKGITTKDFTILALATVFLHTDGVPYVEVRGVGAESIFMQIFSKNCIGFPNGSKIKGSVILKLSPGSSAEFTNAKKQLVEVADLTLFPNKLFLNAALEAKLLGSMWVKLANEEQWGIC